MQYLCIRYMREEDLHMCLKKSTRILRIKKFSFVTRWVACMCLSVGSCETFNSRYFQLMFAQVTILDKYMISTVHEYMST